MSDYRAGERAKIPPAVPGNTNIRPVAARPVPLPANKGSAPYARPSAGAKTGNAYLDWAKSVYAGTAPGTGGKRLTVKKALTNRAASAYKMKKTAARRKANKTASRRQEQRGRSRTE